MVTTGRAAPSDLGAAYSHVRHTTERLASVLSAEDQTVQSMPDVSPTKWHRAHVTWFFETFVLGQYAAAYEPYDEAFGYIFNSYYEAVGARHPRAERGLLSRPGIEEIARYRRAVDRAMEALLPRSLTTGPPRPHRPRPPPRAAAPGAAPDGHQARALEESAPPGLPAWRSRRARGAAAQGGLDRTRRRACADRPPRRQDSVSTTSYPRHTVHLAPFGLADRPVTCGEWLDFMRDEGYGRPEVLALRRVGGGQRAVLGSAPVLVPRSGRSGALAAIHPVWCPPRRSRTSRCATSATTKRTRSPTGQGCVSPQRRSGRRSRDPMGKGTTSSRRTS